MPSSAAQERLPLRHRLRQPLHSEPWAWEGRLLQGLLLSLIRHFFGEGEGGGGVVVNLLGFSSGVAALSLSCLASEDRTR